MSSSSASRRVNSCASIDSGSADPVAEISCVALESPLAATSRKSAKSFGRSTPCAAAATTCSTPSRNSGNGVKSASAARPLSGSIDRITVSNWLAVVTWRCNAFAV